MIGRVAAAAGCLVVFANAQLIVQAPVDLEDLKNELGQESFGTAATEKPGPLSSPTLCDSSVKQHSGYLQVSDDSNYFFWMFESRSSPNTEPLVLWLTGGPGCSSQLAALRENGPCNID